LGAAILMMKTQIGLGVLSIPLVFDTLGMIPGIVILVSIAIITTWVRGKSDDETCVTRPFLTSL
jgi:amino acid permease